MIATICQTFGGSAWLENVHFLCCHPLNVHAWQVLRATPLNSHFGCRQQNYSIVCHLDCGITSKAQPCIGI